MKRLINILAILLFSTVAYSAIEPPVIDSVSIDPFDKNIVSISWHKSVTPGIVGYIIYRDRFDDWIPIDTIDGVNDTIYIDRSANAGQHPEEYRVAAIDANDNYSPMSEKHNTIYTFTYQQKCNNIDRVTWEPYINMICGISKYDIFCSINGDSYDLIGSVDGNTHEYLHADVKPDTSYSYYVQAYNCDETVTSRSNKFSHFFELPADWTIFNVDYASVTKSNNVEISLTTDPDADVTSYNIYRSNNIDGPFSLIQTIPKPETEKISIIDTTANPDNQEYYYKAVITGCDKDLHTSDVFSTIHLEVKANLDYTHELEWNELPGWLGGVSKYYIYRKVDETAGYVLIDSVYSGTTYYVDTLENNGIDFQAIGNNFDYYIKAIEGDYNPYNIVGISSSNEDILEELPRLYMPNAFNPSSAIEENKVFKPVASFVATGDYRLEIYDRWGNLLFGTDDPNVGWDGKRSNGKNAQQGMYIYYVGYAIGDEEIYEKTGIFMLAPSY